MALVADIDIAGDGHGAKRYPPTLEAALALLGDIPLPPSYIINSGGGAHAWWLLREPWTFDDGAELGSYNTQQHWLAHGDGLFLAYTRRGADNDHIFRHRAPLFIAQVDPDRLCVLRATEAVLIPERGATMGNFGAGPITARESWVTVGEGMFFPEVYKKGGATGAVFVARVRWQADH